MVQLNCVINSSRFGRNKKKRNERASLNHVSSHLEELLSSISLAFILQVMGISLMTTSGNFDIYDLKTVNL